MLHSDLVVSNACVGDKNILKVDYKPISTKLPEDGQIYFLDYKH